MKAQLSTTTYKSDVCELSTLQNVPVSYSYLGTLPLYRAQLVLAVHGSRSPCISAQTDHSPTSYPGAAHEQSCQVWLLE